MPKDIVNEDDRTRNVTLRGVAADKGVLTFPLSSEEPYRRYDGNEILVHDKKSVDLSFLNSGNAPLLDNHNRHTSVRTQIGVIDKAWLSGKRIYVTVRFSNRAEAQEIKQDIEDGILTNVSVGYDVLKVERDADSEDYRVTSWKPKEASVVSVPADTTVGVGRAATMEGDMPKDENSPSREGERIEMPAGVPAQVETQPTEADRGAEIAAAQEEIFALGAVHNMRDEASKFINTEIRAGRVPSLAAFRGLVATQLPADRELVDTSIGLTDKETRGFSVLRLARAMADGATQGDRRAAEFEIEACTEAARSAEGETRGYRLPMDVMNRWTDFEIEGVRYQDVRAALSTTGNPNVQDTDHLAGRFIDNLRNQMSIMRAGVTVLGGLSGNIEIPGGDTNAAGAWLAAEDADAAETVPTFRKVTMDIKDVAGYTDLTRRMIIQSSIDVEAYVRSQLTIGMALEIDAAGLEGSGAAGVPTGVKNTAGIGSVTFAAANPTWGEVIDLETSVADANALMGNTGYIGNTSMRGAFKQTEKATNTAQFIMSSNNDGLNGYEYIASNQVTSGDLYFGNWADLLMGMWGGLDLDRDTAAKFLSGGIRLRAIQSVDFAVARVGSFALGNDGV